MSTTTYLELGANYRLIRGFKDKQNKKKYIDIVRDRITDFEEQVRDEAEAAVEEAQILADEATAQEEATADEDPEEDPEEVVDIGDQVLLQILREPRVRRPNQLIGEVASVLQGHSYSRVL